MRARRKTSVMRNFTCINSNLKVTFHMETQQKKLDKNMPKKVDVIPKYRSKSINFITLSSCFILAPRLRPSYILFVRPKSLCSSQYWLITDKHSRHNHDESEADLCGGMEHG